MVEISYNILMFGFEMAVNNKPVTRRDYSKILRITGKIADVHLPEKWIPTAFSDELLGFDYSYFNVRMCGCEHTAQDIVQEWTELDAKGFPLSKVTEAFVVTEIYRYAQGVTPVFSPWIGLAELVDLIRSCKGINGFAQKLNRVKKSSLGLTRELELGRTNQRKYLEKVGELTVRLSSWISEFTIIRKLTQLNYRVSLPIDGYDIDVEGVRAGRVEVKLRNEPVMFELIRQYERMKKGEYESLGIDQSKLLMLMYWTASRAPLDRAFQKQNARIVFVDISHTFAGFTMHAVLDLLKIEATFERAVGQALKFVDSNKDSIVIYSKIASAKPEIVALAFERETVQEIGNMVDKLRIYKETSKEYTSRDTLKMINEILSRTTSS